MAQMVRDNEFVVYEFKGVTNFESFAARSLFPRMYMTIICMLIMPGALILFFFFHQTKFCITHLLVIEKKARRACRAYRSVHRSMSRGQRN